MNDAKKMLNVLFGERLAMDLKAGKTIEEYRKSMKMNDDDIVEKKISCLEMAIGGLIAVAQKGNKELINVSVRLIKDDIMVIANLAFEHILENDYLKNKTE